MLRVVYYAAVSVDGYIATPDGGVAWLDPFHAPELGYEEFLGRVGAVVLGRATYEQSLTFGPWPYGDREGLVVTSRPVEGLPPRVRAIPIAELAPALRDLRARVEGEVWIVGGGRTARACLDAGLLDELELYVVPRLLGDGVPLFERRERLVSAQLVETRALVRGVVMLRYTVARDA